MTFELMTTTTSLRYGILTLKRMRVLRNALRRSTKSPFASLYVKGTNNRGCVLP
jgi:hypothetical protein